MISDSNIPLILAGLVFFVIFFVLAGILMLLARAREKRARIEKVRHADEEWISMAQNTDSLEKPKESGNGFVKLMEAIGMKTMSGKTAKDSKTKLKLLRAGLRKKNTLPIFWGVKMCLAVIFALGFIFLTILFKKAFNPAVLLYLTFLFGMVGLMLPNFWLIIRTQKRQKRIFRAFPDALDLLVVCVEAGMGLDLAIHRVGKEIGLTHPDLGDELKILNLDLNAGKQRNAAFKSLAQRIDIEDVKNLVTLIIQTDRFGTSIAQALRVYAETFRSTRYQRADEIAAKMGTKLVFPLAFCIFPSFFIVGVGPAVIKVFRAFIEKN